MQPNSHDAQRSLLNSSRIAHKLKGLISDDLIESLTACIDAAILSCVSAKGEPLADWELKQP